MIGRGRVMTGRADCPSWCAEDVPDPIGMQHRVFVGDVRLTRVAMPGTRRTVCAVRGRAGRTEAEAARLWADLLAAARLLRNERAKRRTVFQGNVADSTVAQLSRS